MSGAPDPIVVLLAIEFRDPEGIDTRYLEPGDEVDEGLAEMVATDAAELIENHWRVTASLVVGFDRLVAIARQILDKHYPAGTIVCDRDSPDPGPRLAAALRDCEEVIRARS